MKKFALIFSLMVVTFYDSAAQQAEFGWLIGTWKLKDKNIYEQWKPAADGKTLEGFSFKVKDRDTVAMETIRLTYDRNAFHYIPVAGNQGPVDFKVSKHDSHSFVAENPAHDFPKLIRYAFVQKDSKDFINAAIEGNGKVIPYFYERVK
jgi:hypothetical protein